MKKIALGGMVLSLIFAVSGCVIGSGHSKAPVAAGTRTLRVLTHDSFDVDKALVAEFEQANNAKVEFNKLADAGVVVNTAILDKSNPIADVLYGVDNTYLTRATQAGIFSTYISTNAGAIKSELMPAAASRGLVTPVDYGNVCLVYDKTWFEQHKVALPATISDLTQPAYKNLLVVENPSTSSPGMAFFAATIGYLGENNDAEYWHKLLVNGTKVVDGWSTAYNTEFTAGGGSGSRPLVVSYNSDPASDVYFSEGKTSPGVAVLDIPGSCFRQVEYVGILKGSKVPDLAQKWVDFMTSVKYQEDIPLKMWVYPANNEAKLPDVLTKFATEVRNVQSLDEDTIGQKRQGWLDEWQKISGE